MAKVLLSVKDLKVYYPVRKGFFKLKKAYVKAVDGVSFDVYEGEAFGIVGESGCGKSTTGHTIVGLLQPYAGEISFDGKVISGKKRTADQSTQSQIIFQDPYSSLDPRFTVGRLIAEPLKVNTNMTRADINAKVKKLMKDVGLNESQITKYPHEFSGGQRQRIVIARALAVQPKLIVCDEPVSALDVSVQAQILNLLKDLQEQLGMAYLFVAHGMPAVRFMSDRIGVMYLGKLVEVADGEALFEEQLHPYTKALMSAIPVADPDRVSKRTVLSGDVPSPVHLPKGCRFQTRCCCVCDRCRIEEPPLRQVRPGRLVACHLVAETP